MFVFEPWLTAKVLSNLRHTLAREFIDHPCMCIYLYEYYMFPANDAAAVVCRFHLGPSFTAIRIHIHTLTHLMYMYKYPTRCLCLSLPFHERKINIPFSLFFFFFWKKKRERLTKRYLNKFEEFVGLIEFITLLGERRSVSWRLARNTAWCWNSRSATTLFFRLLLFFCCWILVKKESDDEAFW